MSAVVRRSGWATFRGERVEIAGDSDLSGHLRVLAEHTLLEGFDPTPPDPTYQYSRDSRGLADVPVDQLTRIVLVEERSSAIATMSPEDAGLFASVDGEWVRLLNTTGFVRDGEAMVQVLSADEGLDARPVAIRRSEVVAVERREVHATWRGVHVDAVAIGPAGVLVKGDRQDMPELVEDVHPTDVWPGPWSAVVDPRELRPTEATSWRRGLQPASFPSPIAEIDGEWWPVGAVTVVPDGRVTGDEGTLLAVDGGDAPDGSMRSYPRSQQPWTLSEWRRCVSMSEVERLEWPTTVAVLDDVLVPISLVSDGDPKAYDLQGALVPLDRIASFRHESVKVTTGDLPEVPFRRTYLEMIGVDGLDEFVADGRNDTVTLMQKAVTPQQSEAILSHGLDRIAGYVLKREDVAYARTPGELFAVHGLGFEGSPFSPDGPIDVLLFESTPLMRFEDAIGGTSRAEMARTGGVFLDRPPFVGTGFAPVEHPVPVWWLQPTRVPPGARLVRFEQGVEPRVMIEYGDVGTGWLTPPSLPRHPVAPSAYVGTYATVEGVHRLADVVGDRVAIFEPSTASRAEVALDAVTSVFELHVLGSWNGLDVRVVAKWPSEDGQQTRIVYLGHDADLAEGLGLVKVEAGVYEATVPESALDGLRNVVVTAADDSDV